MPLCSVCRGISFADLPLFPEDLHGMHLTGKKYIHPLVRQRSFAREPATSSVRHHADVEHLREAAAAGCELCTMIREQLDLILSEIEALTELEEKHCKSSYQPTVNLWLTKRPYGGQGFWVLSESVQSNDEKELVPIAAFGFSVSEDNLLSNTIDTRPLLENPEALALQKLSTWNTECEKNHDCYQASEAVPRYLIDVGISESETSVKRVQLGDKSPVKYAALSYSSRDDAGSYQKPEIQSENDRCPISDIPKMFQDAILVTRRLGIQYLWIDSMCMSGTPQEWERGSEEFASVYENAFLTISATGAKTATDGLLFSRSSQTSISLPYRTSDGTVMGSVSATLLSVKKEILREYVSMKDEPLSKDLWSFQERVLSRRIVHFASDQVYFECHRCFKAENGMTQGDRYHSSVEKLRGGPDYILEQTLLGRWYRLVGDYGLRQPDTPSDRLLGLANVARAFQPLLDDEYIAGMWKKSLLECLCWQSSRCKPLPGTTSPSWSWASVGGRMSAGFRDRSVKFEAVVINIQATLVDEADPFGNVVSASILMEAPLVPLTLAEPDGDAANDSEWSLFLRTEVGHKRGFYPGFDVIDPRYKASAEIIRSTKLFALVVAETERQECLTGSCHAPKALVGLVVSPVNGSEDAMKRVGCFWTSFNMFGTPNLSDYRKTITLI